MPLSVWLAIFFLAAISVPVVYYGFVMARAFVRARKEVSAGHGSATSGDSFESMRAEAAAAAKQARTEAGARGRRGASDPKGRGRAPVGAGGGTARGPASAEDADVEKVLADLEKKVSGPGDARITRKSTDTSKAEDVQHRTPGASGDPGDRASGGGA